MKTIVTGGAGFIGSHLCDQLVREGHEITVIDNCSTGRVENLQHLKDKIKFVQADIGTQGAWQDEFKGKDWVFHIAALADIVPSIQQPKQYFEANVQGTFHVLSAAHGAGVKRLVYSASSSCYGIPDVYPTEETAEIKPQYPYALTKRMGEELVLHWGLIYKLPVISLRFFNVYGPRSRTSGTYGAVLGVFLAQKLAGKPYTVVGDGEQTRDFTFVTDIADAIVTAAKSDKSGQVYNVGSGKTVSVNKLVELLGGGKVFIPKRPGEPDTTFADISKIQKELSWLPKVDIETGVNEVLKNIEYWRNAPVWTPDSINEATKDWFKFLGK
ncbi:SDR family oxidoreductase [Leptospira ilyithenensis]|uniref:SDR family oxidoreductase n=1 Tax=Leptospira ilyithenensis TaxID=2484901 RepID=A0A4R9LMQ8_9LEPT|nr:SDR family oxidoreductase [Leptospira ilyithenensis]TGN07977.1 SDR family oxidoreductase [Leptospira ilyithenensis]